MADLVFKYGSMGSSKSAFALMLSFSYAESGKSVLLLKPSIDTRDGEDIIKSRVGIKAPCKVFSSTERITTKFIDDLLSCDVILVDEAQFASKKQIEELKAISEEMDKPVYCFGLRTDFQTNMFEGSKRLFELATKIESLPKKCECGNEAIVNARYDDNGIVYDGDQVVLGSNDSYKALCYTCYKRGRLHVK